MDDEKRKAFEAAGVTFWKCKACNGMNHVAADVPDNYRAICGHCGKVAGPVGSVR